MWVAGIDYSTRAVDIVSVPLEVNHPPVWERFTLEGADAFERTRQVARVMYRGAFWDDVLAVGIEHPAGSFGVGPMLRIQGAILACIPARMLVEPLPPAKWRKLVGLPGNATKQHVAMYALDVMWETLQKDWPQDALDAYCIALATRTLLLKEKAA